ncbi:MAG: phosphatase PAP2 family protein [bacterium]
MLTSPLRWRGNDWALFGGLVAGTVALSLIDEDVNSFFQRNQGKIGNDLSEIGVELGEARVVVLLTGGVYAFGLIGDNDWARETAVILTASLIPMGSVQALTNNLVGRARPKIGEGAWVFDPFTRQEAYASFFSGHTLTAMSMAHVFGKRIDNPAAKIFFYGAGSLAAVSRLYNEDHWLTDVVFASAVSITSVNAVAKWLERRRHGKRWSGTAQLRVRPWLRGVQLGLEW